MTWVGEKSEEVITQELAGALMSLANGKMVDFNMKTICYRICQNFKNEGFETLNLRQFYVHLDSCLFG